MAGAGRPGYYYRYIDGLIAARLCDLIHPGMASAMEGTALMATDLDIAEQIAELEFHLAALDDERGRLPGVWRNSRNLGRYGPLS
jgi:hypothetical protein